MIKIPRHLAWLGGAFTSVIAVQAFALSDNPPVLSPNVPFDVSVTKPVSLTSLQHNFDVLSWQTFIALNWPARADGSPDTSTTIGKTDAPTVWEAWKESYQIFLAKGAKPQAWDQPSPPPAACQGKGDGRVLQQMGKVAGVLDEFIQPFKTGPLVDQSGQYTRNEISVNKPMFDDIFNNGLYSVEGQQQFLANSQHRIAFSCGSNQTGEVGAIMVKAAWKVLDANDSPAQFHTVDALVYTPGNQDPNNGPIIEESCSAQKVGLVGLHIVHKTADAPQWVWSTFEHVRNVPEQSTPVAERHGPYLFYDAKASDRPINEPPPRPWNPAIKATPSQIVRQIPINAPTRALNAQWQGALKGTVWANYHLVSTQWPTKPADDCQVPSPTDPVGAPAPSFLANATLETYNQGSVPQASSSCMECHNNATTKVTQSPRTSFADFTFLLERAQSSSAKE